MIKYRKYYFKISNSDVFIFDRDFKIIAKRETEDDAKKYINTLTK